MTDTSREWFKYGEDFSVDVLLHISEKGACGRMPDRESLIEGYIRKEINLEVHYVLRVDDHLCYFVAIFESAEADDSEVMNRTRSSINSSARNSASNQNRKSVFVSIPELVEEMKIGGGLPFRSVVRLLVHNPLLNFTGEPFYFGEVFRRSTVGGFMEFETKSFISAVELPQAPDEVVNYCSKVVDRISGPESQEQRCLTPNPEAVLDTGSDIPFRLYLTDYFIWPAAQEDIGVSLEVIHTSACPGQSMSGKMHIVRPRITHVSKSLKDSDDARRQGNPDPEAQRRNQGLGKGGEPQAQEITHSPHEEVASKTSHDHRSDGCTAKRTRSDRTGDA